MENGATRSITDPRRTDMGQGLQRARAAARAPRTGNCPACWHLWELHGPAGCAGKVYPAQSLTGEPCPCERRKEG